jgi:hypothetical protein
MIKTSLHAFVDSVLERKTITLNDVQMLCREVLPDGLTSREDADVLIALDRAVPHADLAWAEYLVGAVVEFVVWASRPTGYISCDEARWLVTSLGCGTGPTRTALRIAYEVVKEAQEVDEALVAFALRHGDRRPAGATGHDDLPFFAQLAPTHS